ncbi:MAG: type II glyceraldehyde-3-phosphate dehydrogenase [Candidatus Aenigmarchaeota archaeon]|nr:type II glyceraldehyde-3-phosphate dehydrogenase [Candidatus Aenigmarchaeota archaeon]
MKTKVAINGYGTIGKRVADAVAAQDDMEVVGVVKTRPTIEAKFAIAKNYPLYVTEVSKKQAFVDADIPIAGTLDDLLAKADIVVDCAPGKLGAENKKIYETKGIKAIFQGGEKEGVADASFNAQNNFRNCIGKQFIRVVSCNTTGLCRTLGEINRTFGVKKARVVLMRRGPDPGDSKKGPVNAIVPNPATVPSHHGPDVNSVLPDMKIVTSAVIVPTTLMHMHSVMVELEKEATTNEVKELFERAPRIITVRAKEGIESTAQIMEYARDAGRSRSDLNEIAVWEESINVLGNELFYMQAIHQESDVVPENIDAIRAMTGLTEDAVRSMIKTDTALKLKKWW